MHILSKKAYLILLMGDISVLYTSVWITLALRYLEVPNAYLAGALLISVSFLFIPWFTILYLAGLYGRYTTLFKKNLPSTLFVAQTINVGLAAVLFFVMPFFKITPKTILIIYLFISTGFLYMWRVYIYPNILVRRDMNAIMIGSGDVFTELVQEIEKDSLYPLHFKAVINPEKLSRVEIENAILLLTKSSESNVIVANIEDVSLNEIVPTLYDFALIKKSISFIDVSVLYQEVFDRLSLSFVENRWLLKNIHSDVHNVYDILKRVIDIFVGAFFLIVATLVYPFVALAIKVEDGGPILIQQKRIGKNRMPIILYKFRSMKYADEGAWIDKDGSNGENQITRVGGVLRKTHIDELPQILNVLKGDISLVGPRPDINTLYKTLEKTIPFYSTRYEVKPGLTGWAQVMQVYKKGNISPQSVDETRLRLQYDLYYIQQRSLLLDIKILLKTFKVVLFGKPI